MRMILYKLTRQQLRDLAEVHGIPRGRDKRHTAENIRSYLTTAPSYTLKEILTYITACL